MSQEKLLEQGFRFFQAGRMAEAEQLFGQVLASEPLNIGANKLLGFIRAQQGRYEEALKLMGVAIEREPKPAATLVNYGSVQEALGRLDNALTSFDRAVLLQPDLAEAFNNRGTLLHRLGRLEAALTDLERAKTLQPDDAATWNNYGNLLRELGRQEEALASLDRAVQLAPDMAIAWTNRGNALNSLERTQDALESYAKALALEPRHAEAHYNRGVALEALERFEEALASYDQALAVDPNFTGARFNRGGTLRQLQRYKEALICFEDILSRQPDHAKAWHARAFTVMHQELAGPLSPGQIADALASLEKAVALDPNNIEALTDRGFMLRQSGRAEDALADFTAALARKPDHPVAFYGLTQTAQELGDWAAAAQADAQLEARIAQGFIVQPLTLQSYRDDGALLRQAAENFIRRRIRTAPAPLAAVPYRHKRIRIAYVAADFSRHVVAEVLIALIERHDRARFETIGVCFRPDDGSPLRARFNTAFGEMIDASGRNYRDVATMLREREVDIVVDLNGYTGDAHPEIFSYRPAPVQVNFLGFPGTMGAQFMDYIIGDANVTPMAAQEFFAEKIVQLPGCYLPCDTSRPIAATPTRKEVDLPESGFVFAAFNAKWKITAAVFDVWMRLLKAVPGSVLWMPERGTVSSDRLRAEAARRGVDASRLIFYPFADSPQHLARQRLADLFLDTTPYNAHSTAIDALWMGLPIVTCERESFAARVCASALKTAGLPELVTGSLEEYEELALKLARDPALLSSLREKLAKSREKNPLFDMEAYREGIEAAYTAMWERAEQGEPPQAFAVPKG